MAGTDAAVVEITGIGAEGAGVGRLPDGVAVFVHRTAPGDLAEVRVTERRPRWARARLVALRRPGPDRRPAPCPYYDRCGGCTLEHLAYPAQLRVKARRVADALRRIGRVDVAPPEVVPSPEEFRYRNRVAFTLVRLGAGRVVAGFHELEDPGRVVDVDGACLLLEPALAASWDALRGTWGRDARRLPAGERLRLTLRATADGRATLLVEGGTTEGDPATLLDAVPALAAIRWRPRPGAPAALLAGEGAVPEVWGGESILLGGTAFLQVNRGAAALLEAHVLRLAGEVRGSRVVDAYCGVGLYARRLAAAGAVAVGIELDEGAVAEARRLALPGASFRAGDVAALLPEALPADLAILNPPRTGVAEAVTRALLATPPARILYVSCDPATLARDVARLSSRYRVHSVTCFDLFPQTAHVETVAELVRVEEAGGG